MGKCRDCQTCTRVPILDLLWYQWWRIIWSLGFSWNIGLFIKKCPVCGHWLSRHERRADDSFKD